MEMLLIIYIFSLLSLAPLIIAHPKITRDMCFEMALKQLHCSEEHGSCDTSEGECDRMFTKIHTNTLFYLNFYSKNKVESER